MRFTVNIKKQYAIAILAGILVLAGILTAFAYNPGNNPPANPSVFGHTLNEIDGVTCAAGQAITRTASGWSCVSIESVSCSVWFNTDTDCPSSGQCKGDQPMPSACLGTKPCSLILDSYNNQGGHSRRAVLFYAQESSGSWVAFGNSEEGSGGLVNSVGDNGDGTSVASLDLIVTLGGITLYDDGTSEGITTKWYLDAGSGNHVKITACN